MDRVEKWDRRYLGLARHVATWSKDPSTQTGAVIVDARGRVKGIGYNGFAQGVVDRPEWLDHRVFGEDARRKKYAAIIHCEENAILTSGDCTGCTLYTWPFQSCAKCTGLVIQSGIVRHVAPVTPPELRERWAESIEMSRLQFSDAGVELVLYEGLA